MNTRPIRFTTAVGVPSRLEEADAPPGAGQNRRAQQALVALGIRDDLLAIETWLPLVATSAPARRSSAVTGVAAPPAAFSPFTCQVGLEAGSGRGGRTRILRPGPATTSPTNRMRMALVLQTANCTARVSRTR